MGTGSPFSSIQVASVVRPHAQVRDQIRAMILSGELAPGTRLPTTRELAVSSGTSIKTVHRALADLAKEGLLIRTRGSGTFVRERSVKLTNVGLYFPYDPWGGDELSYQRALVTALKKLGAEHGLRISNWIDPRPLAEQGEPWCELVQAIQTSQIDGLICPLVDWPHLNWLDKLQIPRVFSASVPQPRCLDANLSQLAQLSVQAAVDQGARSIGIISPLGIDGQHPDGLPDPAQDFYLEFISEARAKGLTVHNEWVLTGKDEDGSRDQKMWGYHRMHDLWSQSAHPEALVVYPDTAAEGVITALLELGVRVPQDLKLVLHKNDETPLLCPMPAEFIVLSLRDVAAALIDAVEAQFYGKPHAIKPSGFSRQGSPAMQKTQ